VRALSLLSGVALSTAVLTACDGGVTEPPFLPETSPTPTVETTLTPEPTPTVSPADLESFRAFAPQVETALEARDVDFFLEIAMTSTITCPDEFEPRCEGQPPGTIVEGIWLGRWQIEASLLTRDSFRERLAAYLESLANPTVYAIGQLSGDVGGTVETPAFFAVVGSPDDLPNTTAVFEFEMMEGAWRMPLVSEISVLTEEWLSGKCTECYDHWERWEGTP